jgi:hypothetical protein
MGKRPLADLLKVITIDQCDTLTNIALDHLTVGNYGYAFSNNAAAFLCNIKILITGVISDIVMIWNYRFNAPDIP